MERQYSPHATQMLAIAERCVRDALPHVDTAARISHIGFRAKLPEEWQGMRSLCAELGREHMTLKDNGRRIAFIQLYDPIHVGEQVLEYLEFPEPDRDTVHKPPLIAVFCHPVPASPKVIKILDIRQSTHGAEDFIAQAHEHGGR